MEYKSNVVPLLDYISLPTISDGFKALKRESQPFFSVSQKY